MPRIRLNGPLSYDGPVKATRMHPFADTDEKTAAELVAGGFFVYADDPCACVPHVPPDASGVMKTADMMNLAELKACAKSNGIDITGLKTKARIAAAIEAKTGELAQANTPVPDALDPIAMNGGK